MILAPTLRAEQLAAPTTRPGLQQLNDETTALYEQVEAGMVHVEIPRPLPMFRPELLRQQEQRQPIQPSATASPTTRPAGADPTSDADEKANDANPAPRVSIVAQPGACITVTAQSATGGQVTVVRSQVDAIPQPPANESAGNPVLGARLRAAMVAPSNNIGILLDKQGHVLVPTFIDRPADPGAPGLRVAGPDGSMQAARFVGADRQTNLSVLQLDKPVGTPMKWTGDRPTKGSIVLYVSPSDGSGRLGMWTGGMGEFGVVVSIDGQIEGIARFGQFLSGSDCQLIARQLVQFGAVKRATLGVFISEVQPDDPLRNRLRALGSRSAMRVDDVIAGSAADKAGLKIGDLVLELAGQPVNDIPSFAAAIAARSGRTKIQILRGDKIMSVDADLKPN